MNIPKFHIVNVGNTLTEDNLNEIKELAKARNIEVDEFDVIDVWTEFDFTNAVSTEKTANKIAYEVGKMVDSGRIPIEDMWVNLTHIDPALSALVVVLIREKIGEFPNILRGLKHMNDKKPHEIRITNLLEV